MSTQDPRKARIYNQAYYQQHREDIEERNKRYRESHRAERAAYARKYRLTHKKPYVPKSPIEEFKHFARRFINNRGKWFGDKLKRECRILTHYARKAGVLKLELACQKCAGVLRLQHHHPNYQKPLVVMTLCGKCHKAEHTSGSHAYYGRHYLSESEIKLVRELHQAGKSQVFIGREIGCSNTTISKLMSRW